MSGTPKQFSNRSFTFKCGHTAILPIVGISTKEVTWCKDINNTRGGTWQCKKCNTKAIMKCRKGLGPGGLLTLMTYRLSVAKRNSRYKHIVTPKCTPEEMLKIWIAQQEKCAMCKGYLKLQKSNFDHNHETGKPRGFVHRHCNSAEGYLKKHSNQELVQFIRFIRPEILKNLQDH